MKANLAPAENWYPAGPSMDTEKAQILVGGNSSSEFTAFENKETDLTDQALSYGNIECLQNGVGCVGVNPSDFFVTSALPEHTYYELEFLLANHFWGVDFHFGNDVNCVAGAVTYTVNRVPNSTLSSPSAPFSTLTTPCPGISLRQGIAHLLDKSTFAASNYCPVSCIPLDNPVPPIDGLPIPNPCAWDTLFPSTVEAGPCEVGPIPNTSQAGGVSYHFFRSSIGNCATTPLYSWEPGCGTPDFCSAADHFVAAGLATAKDPSTCTLACCLNPSVTTQTVNIFTEQDEPRKSLGHSIADELCALFTGTFRAVGNTPMCPEVSTTTSQTSGAYITETMGPPNGFPGYQTSKTNLIPENWWIYTASFSDIFPFDASLYGIYNSIYASNNGSSTGFGVGDIPPCNSSSSPNGGASDYIYNCIPTYDTKSNAMEFAPCQSSIGDPTPGQTTPTFADCSGTTQLTATSMGYQTENMHGQNVVTIPVLVQKDQYGYLSNWSGAINRISGDAIQECCSYSDSGLPHFYTWLNAHTFNPASSGILQGECPSQPAIVGPDCLRQGFGFNTISLNPYDSSTFWDFSIINNVYDSLLSLNPLDNNQLYGYMTTGFPTQLTNDHLGYTPAAGTTTSFRFTLRNDIFFHDGAPLTSFDVKFSFLTYKASGGLRSIPLAQMTGIHVLNSRTFDVNLGTFGPFMLPSIGSLPVIPGSHWSAGGMTAWDSAISNCSTSTAPDNCFTTADPSAFNVSPNLTSPTFDPLANGMLIGSGPWECMNPGTGAVGGGCSSTGHENPGAGGYYQLTAFGAGTTPGTAVPSSQYFRSSGKLAIYVWSGNNGGSTHDFLNSSTVASCLNKPVGTASCTQWQKGIGNPSASGATVGFLQVSAADSFDGVHWTAPFDYLPGISYACCTFTPNAPTGVAPLPMLLYAGVSNGNTGNPFASGAQEILSPAATAGCTAAYPTGGYDC